MTQDHPATQVHAALSPLPDEPVIIKRRVSAFSGSDLDVLLRGAGANALVLGGISTSGVVLSTVRQAADLDYRLTVLADACADPDPEVHRVLTEKVFPRQALVTSTDEWIAGAVARARSGPRRHFFPRHICPNCVMHSRWEATANGSNWRSFSLSVNV